MKNESWCGRGRVPRASGLGCGLAAAALAVALVPTAASAAQPSANSARARPGPAQIVPGSLRAKAGGLATVESGNWSGYADTTNGYHNYSRVSANWTLPTLKCTTATAGGIASFWVGLDGFTDSEVEQDGTRAICENGTTAEYVDWWEMYPNPVSLVHSTLKAGDQLTGSVTVKGTAYTLAITDHTHPADSFSVTRHCAITTCQDLSAEWIAETHVTGGVALPDYGTLTFTKASVTSVSASGTKTGTISSFPHDAITAMDSSGQVNASVSKLTDSGAMFTDIWHRSS